MTWTDQPHGFHLLTIHSDFCIVSNAAMGVQSRLAFKHGLFVILTGARPLRQAFRLGDIDAGGIARRKGCGRPLGQ